MTAMWRLHATSVAFDGKGVLITGASGRGKSGLALQLVAMGALLIADDQTELHATGDDVIARCPAGLQGLIEARGVGLLHAPFADAAPLTLVVDLDQTETDRLPPMRKITLLGKALPLVLGVNSPHFPAALKHYVLSGRHA